MTVAELKEMLKDYPDSDNVSIMINGVEYDANHLTGYMGELTISA